jgi:hypothetical protein
MGYTSDTQRAGSAAATALTQGRSEREQKLAQAAAALVSTQIDQAVDRFKQTTPGQIFYNAGKAADNVTRMIDKIKQGEMDAAGIADVSGAGLAVLGNVTAIIAAAGGSGAAVREITKWATTGANCAAGIAATGGLGVFSCGLQVVAGLLEYITSGPYTESWDTPRTIFVPTEASRGMIAADAARLASVLRYYYDVPSYLSLYERLAVHEEFRWLRSNDIPGAGGSLNGDGRYPPRPVMVNGKVVTESTPIPAHNLRTILQVMSLGMNQTSALGNARDTLAGVAGWRSGVEPAGRGLYQRYEKDHDINQHAIATAAYWGRSVAAVGRGTTTTISVFGNSGDVNDWPRKRTNYYVPVTVNLRPFIVVDELINFFGAVTSREIQQGGASNLTEKYGLGVQNPTMHMEVCGTQRTGEPNSCQAGKYSKICWTNLSRATGGNCDIGLILGMPSMELLRDVGAIRLMAAFSYLHQTYLWSGRDIGTRMANDPIRNLPARGDDAVSELRVPVDPRQLVGNTLAPEEQPPSNAARVGRISRASTRVEGPLVPAPNENGVVSWARKSPTTLRQYIERDQAIIKNALKQSGQKILQIVTRATTPADLTAAMMQIRASGIDLNAALANAKRTESGGVGTALALGAAALLALKFLK